MDIIAIDRTQIFDPVQFLGPGWSIEEEDERSLALTEVDLAKIQLEHMLESGEHSINGEEKLRRLKKAGYIRLDAKFFQTLWEAKGSRPDSWRKKPAGNIPYIFFDGTVLRDPEGYRSILRMYAHAGKWYKGYHWLNTYYGASSLSAVLANT